MEKPSVTPACHAGDASSILAQDSSFIFMFIARDGFDCVVVEKIFLFFLRSTLVARTAIAGVRNLYDYPDALLELQETFKRSLHLPTEQCKEV